MNVLNDILDARDGCIVHQVASQFGLQESDVQGAVASMLPGLAAVAMGALGTRTSGGSSGLESLTSLIDLDGDGSVADDMLDFTRKLF